MLFFPLSVLVSHAGSDLDFSSRNPDFALFFNYCFHFGDVISSVFYACWLAAFQLPVIHGKPEALRCELNSYEFTIMTTICKCASQCGSKPRLKQDFIRSLTPTLETHFTKCA